MNPRLAVVAPLLVLVFLSAAPAGAEIIYRWVDKDGVVHFGDQPPQGVQATIVNPGGQSVGLGAGISSPVEAEPAASGPDAEEKLSYAEQRRRERAERRETASKDQAERNRNCAVMRQQRAALEPSPRVIIEDENGNPVRMADEDRLARLEEAKSYLAQNCD